MVKSNPIYRHDILREAIYKCYKEMYKMSQPSVDYDKLLKIAKEDKEDKEHPLYTQHYLSQDNYNYIVDMFLESYNIINPWPEHVKTIEYYLFKGGLKEVYVEKPNESGYRDYEKTPCLTELIGENNTEEVKKLIELCKNFYRFNTDECQFRMSVMQCSPTSNKKDVIEFWKTQGKDIKIKDFDIEQIYYGSDD